MAHLWARRRGIASLGRVILHVKQRPNTAGYRVSRAQSSSRVQSRQSPQHPFTPNFQAYALRNRHPEADNTMPEGASLLAKPIVSRWTMVDQCLVLG